MGPRGLKYIYAVCRACVTCLTYGNYSETSQRQTSETSDPYIRHSFIKLFHCVIRKPKVMWVTYRFLFNSIQYLCLWTIFMTLKLHHAFRSHQVQETVNEHKGTVRQRPLVVLNEPGRVSSHSVYKTQQRYKAQLATLHISSVETSH